MQKQGKLVIFSAPSGSGKTTIVKHLVAQIPQLGYSISACTRPRRGRTEEHGKDYYFLSKEDFEQKIRNDEFVEWEQVYSGAYYGTLKSEIQRIWDEDRHVIFDVDVVGGLRIKEYYGDNAIAVFVKVNSVEELRRRLLQRQTETDASLEIRLAKAEYEMSFEDRFDVVLLNENLEETLQKAFDIVQNFLGNDTKK